MHAQALVVSLPCRLFERMRAASSVYSRRYLRKSFRTRGNAKLSGNLAPEGSYLDRHVDSAAHGSSFCRGTRCGVDDNDRVVVGHCR